LNATCPKCRISPEVWAFTIGALALAETIRLMGEIDAAIAAHCGWPIVD